MSTTPPGLSQTEAKRLLLRDGPNELTPPRQHTLWQSLRDVAEEPMLQLLVAAGLLYLVLGDLGEALMLLAFVLVNITITLVQGRRTEKALQALHELSSPRALVLRDGQQLRIAGREVVCGDLLVLAEGDRVAADAQLLSANDLRADESLLSGEALPADKRVPLEGKPDAPADVRQGFVYAGTLLVGGQGVARVVATGAASEIGRIGRALSEIDSPATPLTLQTRHLVKIFSLIGLSLSVLLVLLYGLLRSDWSGGLLAGITLAMSMLPEEFLLILTVFMAMGAWRLAGERVLTRRAATIEALGAATVLCTDKTGTLTQNRMAVAELWGLTDAGPQQWTRGTEPQAQQGLPEALQPLLEFGILASEREPFDPMDKALLALGQERLPPACRHEDWTLVHEYGLSPELPAMTHVWQSSKQADNNSHQVAVKGGLEAVLRLCRLDAAAQAPVNAAAAEMAARGLRVLGVARASFEGSHWPAAPDSQPGFAFALLGLVALADPLRPGVPEAVQECRAAGIRVLMITGDHPATALAIAAQAGLENAGSADHTLTGAELATLSDAELGRRVASTTLFARVLPDQKLRIVNALQANGGVVAMTGDGVNDAPSLKAAHIGIAMGGRGTDVAREAASLVLLDDDFGSIVHAVRLGRRIYDNLRKAMAFILAVHVPIAGLSMLPLLFDLPLVFMPVHIAFLELMINPACSIVFESEGEEGDAMKRPPRDPAAPLFSRALIGSSLLQGLLVLLATASLFIGLLHMEVPEAQARAASFTALVLCSMALIVVNRSFSGQLVAALRRPNPALWRMLGLTSALLLTVLLLAPLRRLFHFDAMPLWMWGAAFGLGLAVMLALELLQRWRRRLIEP